MVKLLIFDLDGTLIDSAPDIVQATFDLLTARGQPLIPREQVVAAIGEGLKKTVYQLFPDAHQSPEALQALEQDFLRHYERNLIRQATIFPGVERFLEGCPQKIALVTNKHERHTHKTLAGLGLDRFPWVSVFGADSLAARKPDPLPLLEAMKAAGTEPHETLMIGDGIPDMVAARAAGVRAVAVEFGYARLELLLAEGASHTLPHFDKLGELIRHLSARAPERE